MTAIEHRDGKQVEDAQAQADGAQEKQETRQPLAGGRIGKLGNTDWPRQVFQRSRTRDHASENAEGGCRQPPGFLQGSAQPFDWPVAQHDVGSLQFALLLLAQFSVGNAQQQPAAEPALTLGLWANRQLDFAAVPIDIDGQGLVGLAVLLHQ